MSGPLMMFTSAVLFSFMAIMVKIVSRSVSAPEIIFFRSAISVVILVALAMSGRVAFKARSKEKLVFRGIVGGISLMLYFYSLTLTSVANAVLLAYTYPIFAAIFATMYLKENLTAGRIALIASAFIGLLLIFDFDFTALKLGDILALISAVTSGMAIVAIRELRKTDSAAMITFSFVFSGMIFSLFFLKGNFVVPANFEFTLLLLIGFIGTIGQLLMTRAYKICSTAMGGVISMSSVVMTAILSLLIFKETLTANLIIGGLLIFVAAVFFSREEECEIAK